MKLLAPLLSSPPSSKGLRGQQQRPGVNLPLGCHGNKRVEKKGGSPAMGSYNPAEWGRQDRSLLLFSCTIVCLCLNATVLSTLRHHHPPHTHAAAAVWSWTAAWRQIYAPILTRRTAVSFPSSYFCHPSFLQDDQLVILRQFWSITWQKKKSSEKYQFHTAF